MHDAYNKEKVHTLKQACFQGLLTQALENTFKKITFQMDDHEVPDLIGYNFRHLDLQTNFLVDPLHYSTKQKLFQ